MRRRRLHPRRRERKVDKEEIYRILLSQYKCTQAELMELTPAQQLLMMRAIPKIMEEEVFDSMGDYLRWKGSRRA